MQDQDSTPVGPLPVALDLPPSGGWPTRKAMWQFTPGEPWLAEVTLVCDRPGPQGGSREVSCYCVEAGQQGEYLLLPLEDRSGGEIYAVSPTGGCTCKARTLGKRESCRHAEVIAAARSAGLLRPLEVSKPARSVMSSRAVDEV